MIRSGIKESLSNAVKKLGVGNVLNFSVEVPENSEHGDYSTNLAMILAKVLNKNPMEITDEIIALLKAKSYKLEAIQPGFINFFLSSDVLHKELEGILKKKGGYGKKKSLKEKIQVEFISANPTGPLTLANGRGGFFGDALSRILEHQGFEVEREYYINDDGNQIQILGNSLLAAAGKISDNEEYYHGEYIKEWVVQHEKEIEKHSLPLSLGRLASKDFLENFIRRSVEEKMGIKFDCWTSEYEDVLEKKYHEKALEVFNKHGVVFESEEARWLKTTDFGDDKDRVLVTAEGHPTYLAVDAGHHLETRERGFDRKINILGADHHGYVSRIKAVAKILGFKQYEVVIMQMVRLVSGGREVRMSKRKGEFVTIDELIDEVGVDTARFFFLERSPNSHMDFDLELAKKQSQENPVYYVQYAHSRCCSILSKSQISNSLPAGRHGKPQKFESNLLKEIEELRLIKKMIQFPEVMEDTARDFQMQRITKYATELAKTFHNFYEKRRVITDDEQLSRARLGLVLAVKIILKNILDLLGIAAPKKM